MNKLTKLFIFGALSAMFLNAYSQDNPTSLKEISDKSDLSIKKALSFRIYGGPAMDFMYAGDFSTMKGGRFGMNGGIELNKSLTKRVYGTMAFGVTAGGSERWINNDLSVNSKSAFDQVLALDVPIGIGFNLGKEAPRGAYLNLSWINSIVLSSQTNYTIVPFGSFEASSNVADRTYDKYNMGARVEFGYKAKFEGNSYVSFSLAPRVMFYNRFSTNTNQFTGLSVVGLMSFYF